MATHEGQFFRVLKKSEMPQWAKQTIPSSFPSGHLFMVHNIVRDAEGREWVDVITVSILELPVFPKLTVFFIDHIDRTRGS